MERRKALVLQVATEMFLQHGYAEVSLIEIAKRTGVAPQTISQHLGSKEELFERVVSELSLSVLDPPATIPQNASLFTALLQIAGYINAVALHARSLEIMRLMMAEARRFPQLIGELSNEATGVFLAHVKDMFDDVAAHKIGLPIRSDLAAEFFIDLVTGVRTVAFFNGGRPATLDKDALEARVRFFMAGTLGSLIVT